MATTTDPNDTRPQANAEVLKFHERLANVLHGASPTSISVAFSWDSALDGLRDVAAELAVELNKPMNQPPQRPK